MPPSCRGLQFATRVLMAASRFSYPVNTQRPASGWFSSSLFNGSAPPRPPPPLGSRSPSLFAYGQNPNLSNIVLASSSCGPSSTFQSTSSRCLSRIALTAQLSQCATLRPDHKKALRTSVTLLVSSSHSYHTCDSTTIDSKQGQSDSTFSPRSSDSDRSPLTHFLRKRPAILLTLLLPRWPTSRCQQLNRLCHQHLRRLLVLTPRTA